MPNYQHVVDDFMNADRIMGTDIVGARAVARRPRDINALWAGIPITNVGGGATVDVNVAVQLPFRPRRLILVRASGTAPLDGVSLTSLQIDNVDQVINSGDVAAPAFAANAIATLLRGGTAQPGVGIDLRLTNHNSGAITVGGAIFGEAAD